MDKLVPIGPVLVVGSEGRVVKPDPTSGGMGQTRGRSLETPASSLGFIYSRTMLQ